MDATCICLSPLSASPGVKAKFSVSPAGHICLARNRLGDWVSNRKVIPDDTHRQGWGGNPFRAPLGKEKIKNKSSP